MKKKESWIPLLVTLVILGYFVYWAVGFVGRNKPQPAEQPTTLARAVKVEPIATEPAPSESTPVAPPQQRPVPTVTATPYISGEQAGDVLEDSDVVAGRHVTQNRKMLGTAREAGIRH